MKRTILRITCMASLFLGAGLPAWVTAAPVFNPATGHYYDAVLTRTNWSAARGLAESQCHLGLPGHLATITSQAENDFIVTAFPEVLGTQTVEYWIGAYQPAGSPEPGGNWQWVTGEAFVFPHWASAEPNNAGGNEDAAHFYAGFRDGRWNDRPTSDAMAGYVVEFETPPVRIHTAIELEFATRVGLRYQLQSSLDMLTWTDFGGVIEGAGSSFSLPVSTRQAPHRFFRTEPIDLTCGLVAHYPFDGSAADGSGNGNHGTVVGAATPAPDRFGGADKAFYFDGNGSHITIPDAPSLDLTDGVSLLAWVRFQEGGSANPRIVHKHVYQIYTVGTGAEREFVFACPPVAEVRSAPLPADVWTHVAGTYDRGVMRLYINGALVAEVPATGPLDLNDVSINLGRNVQTQIDSLKGALDDVRIYNRALFRSEVKALFNASN